ncbi:biopolymer transporter ExbD [Opitutus sp. ER46]|uniref:ExbD/TolR family protein n=1 Tax=Opitutus sp. ER46 TaxID=2161864 RepID=UPI000D317D85|nr:biopolymer transporter ExbD [Opitutus sp. ER46]PTX98972.1 biopolymer transporter ExbD [Opitutus sp. ER46]
MSLLVTRRRRRPELPLVPLIDVLVMLVLFAYVTMQARTAASLNITLPKAETAGKNAFKGSITIGIDAQGRLAFNGREVADNQLLDVLRQVKNIDREIPVLIRADETAQLKKATFVMDVCRKAGLHKFSLLVRE